MQTTTSNVLERPRPQAPGRLDPLLHSFQTLSELRAGIDDIRWTRSYFALDWLYFDLARPTAEELHYLQQRLRGPYQVMLSPGARFVRCHLVQADDVELLREVVAARTPSPPIPPA